MAPRLKAYLLSTIVILILVSCTSWQERDCKSSLHGVVYATSQVRITEAELYSWDRGFDAEGNQVWGAEGGSYVFRKTVNHLETR
jgi:hypothetical protein